MSNEEPEAVQDENLIKSLENLRKKPEMADLIMMP